MKSAMQGIVIVLTLIVLIGILLGLRTMDEVGDDMENSNGDPPTAVEQNSPNGSPPEAVEVPSDSTNNGSRSAQTDPEETEGEDTDDGETPTQMEEREEFPADDRPTLQQVEGIPALW